MPNRSFPIADPIETVTDRIISVYRSASDGEAHYGRTWYSQANEYARRLADRYDVSVRSAAGIIAALSPQVSWDDNQREADRLLLTGSAKHTTANVVKARHIAYGADPLDVLGGNKVRAFFDNIARPTTSPAVTVDRHAYDAAVGTISADKKRRELERVGVYAFISEAYQRAAYELGTLPLIVQATVWVTHRNAKAIDPQFSRYAHKLTSGHIPTTTH